MRHQLQISIFVSPEFQLYMLVLEYRDNKQFEDELGKQFWVDVGQKILNLKIIEGTCN